MLKHILKVHNIPFIERDIVSDIEARKDFMRTKSKILPVIRISDGVIEGFNANKLRQLVKQHFGILLPTWINDLSRYPLHKLIQRPSNKTIFVM
jgi:hypothetical protein